MVLVFTAVSVSAEDSFDVVQLIEGLQGGEVVDVQIEDLLSDLGQDGIIELEEAKLITVDAPAFFVPRKRGRRIFHLFGRTSFGVFGFWLLSLYFLPFLFETMQDVRGSLYDMVWHTAETGYLNTEAVCTATRLQFAKEEHLAVYFASRYIEVVYPIELPFQLVQFVIMCGEESPGVCLGIVMDVLHDRPGYGDAVIGAGTPS